jgi:large subunit ribosomal protein L29
MKQKDIKELSQVELIERMGIEREGLVKLKLNHTVSPLENPVQIRFKRKSVARIATEIRKREIENASKASK